jgi:hypothetical protein
MDGKPARRAAPPDVHVDALDAMLVEIGVVAERDEVAQQRRAIDARARVADRDARPVRLPGHGTVRFQEIRDEGFVGLSGRGRKQRGIGRPVAFDFDGFRVDRLAAKTAERERVELRWRRQQDFDGAAGGIRQIALGALAQRVRARETFLVEAREIELERLRFDDVRRRRREAELGDGDLGLAARVEPRKLVGVPDVDAVERQRIADAERFALRSARDRK